jgi:hypothetical protein
MRSVEYGKAVSFDHFAFFHVDLHILRSLASVANCDVLISGLVISKYDHLRVNSTTINRLISISEQNDFDPNKRD